MSKAIGIIGAGLAGTEAARQCALRKYAIPLLEWLDSQPVTRRVGDERVIM